MEFRKSDVTKIEATARAHLIKELGVRSTDLVAVGTEAEVYSYGDQFVLKLYGGIDRLTKLQTLQRFYEVLNAAPSGLMLPRIADIRVCEPLLAVIESRIPGCPLTQVLKTGDVAHEDRAIEIYLGAVQALRKIRISTTPVKYLLLDEGDESLCERQRWAEFYVRLVSKKLTRVGTVLASHVSNFYLKCEQLIEGFRNDADIELSVVHGDFFPGNLLVSPDLSRAEGIVDFGSFTMFGDTMLDMAGAVGFYRMYDPQRKEIRASLVRRLKATLEPRDIGRLYRYLAAHAILTCDLYLCQPDHVKDGHFQWALEILDDSTLWSELKAD